MSIVKPDLWKKFEADNQDAYGKCCVDVAREVMRLLDLETGAFGPNSTLALDPHSLICTADKNIGAEGITGFMAGAVAQMVSLVHSRGEEFRRAWNADHGVTDPEKKGVVNPAILTFGDKPGPVQP